MAPLWLASLCDYLTQLSIFTTGVYMSVRHCWNTHTHTQLKKIWFHQTTTWRWEASTEAADMREGGKRERERVASFIWYHNRSLRGRMCCGGCGMAEKIREEHGVAEINRKAAVWKASLSFSRLDPYWYLRSNFRVQIGNEKRRRRSRGAYFKHVWLIVSCSKERRFTYRTPRPSI